MSNDLRGKVYIVTGANTGIGRVTAEELARRGGHLFLAGRSEARTAPVIEEIRRDTGNENVEFLPLDLADPASVRAAAEAFLARGLPLHGLVNNAGLAGQRGLTKDGFELGFGTNHLGPFLFTLLLVDRLKKSAPSRIVNVASRAHYKAREIDWEALRRPTASTGGLGEYSVSKLANVLFTKELARRLDGTGVTTYALHPGVVATDIWRELPWGLRHLAKLFMISPEEGARTTLHCATSPEASAESGLYYDRCKAIHPSRTAQDPALAAELWRRSVEWTGAPGAQGPSASARAVPPGP
jgi:dehydrogenase/reductase SDR family protein 13